MDVRLGTTGARVVGKNRFTETGGFCEPDAAWDHGLKDLVAKEIAEVGFDLAREIGSIIVHGEQDAFDLQGRVEGFFGAVDGVHELRDTLEREELTLDWD